jgi:hypothetical protein
VGPCSFLPARQLRPTMDALRRDVGASVLLLTLRTSARRAPCSNWRYGRYASNCRCWRGRPRQVRLAMSDRWLWVVLARLWTGWLAAVVIVKPETVIAWHRRGFSCGGLGGAGAGIDRPIVATEVGTLIRTMAQANPLCGAPRIHGELPKLGIDVCQATAKYMGRRRQPPSQTWRTFLRNHSAGSWQPISSWSRPQPTGPCSCCCCSRMIGAASRTSRSPHIRQRDGRLRSCSRRFVGRTASVCDARIAIAAAGNQDCDPCGGRPIHTVASCKAVAHRPPRLSWRRTALCD